MSQLIRQDISSFQTSIFEATRGMRFLFQPSPPHFFIVAVTQDMCEYVNMSKEELIGKDVFEVFPANPNDEKDSGQKDIRTSLEYVLRHKKENQLERVRYDVQLTGNRFRERYWNIYDTPILNEEGEVAYIIHTSDDVTELVKAGEDQAAHQELQVAYQKLLESEEKYRSLFDAMDQGFCVLEIIFDEADEPVDYRFLEINPIFEKQTGLKNAVGKTATELVPGLEKHWFELYGKVALTGEATRFSQGSEAMGRWYDVYAYRTGRPEARRVALLFTDVTDKKVADKILRQSEANLRNIILQAPVAMCLFKGEDHVVEIGNELMFRFWGKDPVAFTGKPIFDTLPEAKSQGFEEMLNVVYLTGETVKRFGVPVSLPRNEEILTVYVDFVYEPYREKDGTITGVVAAAFEVTEQVLARKKVEAAEVSLRNAIDIAALGTWSYDVKTQNMTYSQRMMDWYGFDQPTEPYATILESLHKEDQPRHHRYLVHDYDWKDDGTIADVHTIINRKTGRNYIIFSIGKQIRDENGTLVRIEGMSRDVTMEHNTRQALETEVQQRTEQLAAAIDNLKTTNQELQRSNAQLEEFAFAASHDLKEPIRKISIFTGRLKNQLADKLGPEERDIFRRVENASLRMNDLINDLLHYSHVSHQPQQSENVDLDEVLKRVIEVMELSIEEKKAQVTVNELPVLVGSKRQLQQLFQNLISNSLKYSRPGVAPSIDIKSTIVSGGEEGLPAEKAYHLITVTDNGIGFDNMYAERIFQIFKRLQARDEYEGTGVGLSIARKVVENHNGKIVALGMPGEGATFKIYLPV
ncbi:ATP-binding protein [Telluribacter humicola]|uniref:ATP-binding protein n=1 Tax=Telluribacter humicola TaxID=1720261 RepID=UPI001A977572|nr:ATP-binding protein [Telluribacter humicola]